MPTSCQTFDSCYKKRSLVCQWYIYSLCGQPAWFSWAWGMAALSSLETRLWARNAGMPRIPPRVLKMFGVSSGSLLRGPNYWQCSCVIQQLATCSTRENTFCRWQHISSRMTSRDVSVSFRQNSWKTAIFIQLSGYKQNREWCWGVLSGSFVCKGEQKALMFLFS